MGELGPWAFGGAQGVSVEAAARMADAASGEPWWDVAPVLATAAAACGVGDLDAISARSWWRRDGVRMGDRDESSSGSNLRVEHTERLELRDRG